MRANNHFGDATFSMQSVAWPASAAEALDFIDHAYAAWMGGVKALTEPELARPCGPSEGPFSDHPFAALVLHINREVIHHGAEVACLRDLYRATGSGRLGGVPTRGVRNSR